MSKYVKVYFENIEIFLMVEYSMVEYPTAGTMHMSLMYTRAGDFRDFLYPSHVSPNSTRYLMDLIESTISRQTLVGVR